MATVLIVAGAVVVGFLGFVYWALPSKDKGRLAQMGSRIGARAKEPISVLAPRQWGLVALLVGVFTLAWWVTTRGAADALDRAERAQRRAFPSGSDRAARTQTQIAAIEGLNAAKDRVNTDRAIGIGAGLGAVVLTLAGVFLWQRIQWSRPNNP